MELNSEALFFIGIISLILGSLIILFDYPQIQSLDKVESGQECGYLEISDVHERLKIEITVGGFDCSRDCFVCYLISKEI